MKDEEIEGLLDQASALYNDGRYDDAIAIWQKILAAHPDHERALEGIKMAQLLTSDWERASSSPPPPAGEASALRSRVQEGIQRVNELLAAGDIASAGEGVEALLAVAPDDAAVVAVAAKVRAAANPQGYVDEQLALARHYTLQGEREEAAEACRRVLAIDPGNATAAEILAGGSRAGDELDLSLDSALPSPGGEPAPDVDSIPLDLSDEVEGMPVESIDADALELNDPVPESSRAAAGGDPKVAALLAEGDRLLAEGRLEEAIDSWSRIFVLQDDNAEAERRIDEARQQLDRRARKMEEHLTRGEDLISKGLLQEARLEFEAVLRIRPGHAEAASRIQFVDQQLAGGAASDAPGQAPGSAVPPAPAAPAPRPPAPRAAPDLADQEESRLPTPPPPPPKRPAPERPARKKSGKPALVGGAVLILVLAAGGTYLAWQKLFPPAPGPAVMDSAVPPSEDAEQASGPAPAVEPEGDPAPAAGDATPAPGAETPPPAPPQSEAERKQLAAAARRDGITRFRAGDFEAATERLQAALELDPTDFETQDWLTKAEAEWKKVQAFEDELAGVRQGFEDRDYRAALYKLYRIEAPDRRAKSKIDRWIATCWYDWGVMLLKAGNTKEAEEKFREVLDVTPSDRDATQNLEVALRYQERPIDQAYRTFTERLDPRPLD